MYIVINDINHQQNNIMTSKLIVTQTPGLHINKYVDTMCNIPNMRVHFSIKE